MRHAISFLPFFDPKVINKVCKHSPEIKNLRHLYKIEPNISNQLLLDLGNELQSLDYVEYCNLLGKQVDQSPIPQEPPLTPAPPVPASSSTPNFTDRQGYLDVGKGMNIRAVWARGKTGRSVTTRIGGTAIVPNHEDLAGLNIILNRVGVSTDQDTASVGAIRANNNGFGVTGIAYDSDTFFYELYLGGVEQFLTDISPGEVASNPLIYSYNDGTVTASKSA